MLCWGREGQKEGTEGEVFGGEGYEANTIQKEDKARQLERKEAKLHTRGWESLEKETCLLCLGAALCARCSTSLSSDLPMEHTFKKKGNPALTLR